MARISRSDDRDTNLQQEWLHHGSVDLDLLGLRPEHLVELEGLGGAGELLLLDTHFSGVGTVHHTVAASILLRVIQWSTSKLYILVTLQIDDTNYFT